jgi:hypothetical protein
MSVGSVLPHFCVHIKINVRIHARARWPRKTLDWGKKRGGNTEGAPTKDGYFLVIADYEKAFLYVALE